MYSANIFGSEAERLIQQHDVSSPLFLYLPFQSVHGPWEAPAAEIAKYQQPGTPHYIADTKRQIYGGMLSSLSDSVCCGKLGSAAAAGAGALQSDGA